LAGAALGAAMPGKKPGGDAPGFLLFCAQITRGLRHTAVIRMTASG
jgi:hypothetical protein